MFFNKKIIALSVLILCFVLGFAGGYFVGVNNPPLVKNVFVDNGSAANTSVAKTPAVLSAEKTEISAKAAFEAAGVDARAWSEDSYLSEINLMSKKINAEGLANGWKIIFYSKKKNKFYDVTIKDNESRGGEERIIVDKKIPQALKSEMVDSNILAKDFFARYPADTEISSLRLYYNSGSKKFIWTILFPKGSHTISAEL